MAETLPTDVCEDDQPLEPPSVPHIATGPDEPVATKPSNGHDIDWSAIMAVA